MLTNAFKTLSAKSRSWMGMILQSVWKCISVVVNWESTQQPICETSHKLWNSFCSDGRHWLAETIQATLRTAKNHFKAEERRQAIDYWLVCSSVLDHYWFCESEQTCITIGICNRVGHVNAVKVETRFHLECKLRVFLACVQFGCAGQMHWINLSPERILISIVSRAHTLTRQNKSIQTEEPILHHNAVAAKCIIFPAVDCILLKAGTRSAIWRDRSHGTFGVDCWLPTQKRNVARKARFRVFLDWAFGGIW